MTAQIGIVRQTRKLLQAGSTFGALPSGPDTTKFVVQRDGQFVVQRDGTQVEDRRP